MLGPGEREPLLVKLRRRPEFIVGPAWIAWLLINGLPITFGQPFILSVVQTAIGRGSAGQAFPITYALAIAVFGFALVVLPGLNVPRRLLVAAAVPFAFTHLYEVPYDLVGRLVWPAYYAWATWPIVLLLNLSWLALGLSTAPFWRLRWKGMIVLASVIVTFAIWWIWFFPPWLSIDPPLNPEGSGYMLSKILTALLVAVLLWDGRVIRDAHPVGETEGSGTAARTGVPPPVPSASRWGGAPQYLTRGHTRAQRQQLGRTRLGQH
ncbi:MAG: hypothetical protein L3K17_06835 [Thermoplasmata archaeon]|nr:hypothetical protein [Thermoplasmata archaeon]